VHSQELPPGAARPGLNVLRALVRLELQAQLPAVANATWMAIQVSLSEIVQTFSSLSDVLCVSPHHVLDFLFAVTIRYLFFRRVC
jgi:hypothetical protein